MRRVSHRPEKSGSFCVFSEIFHRTALPISFSSEALGHGTLRGYCMTADLAGDPPKWAFVRIAGPWPHVIRSVYQSRLIRHHSRICAQPLQHYVMAKGQGTFSDYGLDNLLALNVGSRNKHDGFIMIAWKHLPRLKKMCPTITTSSTRSFSVRP